jgi:hypothetical protein
VASSAARPWSRPVHITIGALSTVHSPQQEASRQDNGTHFHHTERMDSFPTDFMPRNIRDLQRRQEDESVVDNHRHRASNMRNRIVAQVVMDAETGTSCNDKPDAHQKKTVSKVSVQEEDAEAAAFVVEELMQHTDWRIMCLDHHRESAHRPRDIRSLEIDWSSANDYD